MTKKPQPREPFSFVALVKEWGDLWPLALPTGVRAADKPTADHVDAMRMKLMERGQLTRTRAELYINDYPPIRVSFNTGWTAVREGYDRGDPIGIHPYSKYAAIVDLVEQEVER